MINYAVGIALIVYGFLKELKEGTGLEVIALGLIYIEISTIKSEMKNNHWL